MKSEIIIAPAKGKLGILTPGMGAVAKTFVAEGLYPEHDLFIQLKN